MSETNSAERAVGQMPGGIRLTVTERCELQDWKDACVEAAVRSAVKAERERCAQLCAMAQRVVDADDKHELSQKMVDLLRAALRAQHSSCTAPAATQSAPS